MKPGYKFLDHTADVLFKAKAPSLSKLFEQCALAVEETQVDVSLIEIKEELKIEMKNKKLDRLLFDFLDDLIYFKDADSLIFGKFDIEVKKVGEEYELICAAFGEKLSLAKHEPKVDVKAVTMHMFEVKEIKGGWEAQVLLDI